MNFENLEEKLAELTGNDYEMAERASRRLGDTSALIALSSVFQARLAAKALGVSYEEIMALPLVEFTNITTRVSGFLFAPSAFMPEQKNEAQ